MRNLDFTPHAQEFLTLVYKDGEEYFEKLEYSLVMVGNEKIPNSTFLKPIRGIKGCEGIFEIRASLKKKKYRLLCFFQDENYSDNLILLNGFVKKDDKTLKKHARIAIRLRTEYIENLAQKK